MGRPRPEQRKGCCAQGFGAGLNRQELIVPLLGSGPETACRLVLLCSFDAQTDIHTYVHTYTHTYIHNMCSTQIHRYIPAYLHTDISIYLCMQLFEYIRTNITVRVILFVWLVGYASMCTILCRCLRSIIRLAPSDNLIKQVMSDCGFTRLSLIVMPAMPLLKPTIHNEIRILGNSPANRLEELRVQFWIKDGARRGSPRHRSRICIVQMTMERFTRLYQKRLSQEIQYMSFSWITWSEVGTSR